MQSLKCQKHSYFQYFAVDESKCHQLYSKNELIIIEQRRKLYECKCRWRHTEADQVYYEKRGEIGYFDAYGLNEQF